MERVTFYFYFFMTKFVFSGAYRDDGLVLALVKVFEANHVQTVTVSTCWTSDVKSRLLWELSSADMSVNFHPSAIPVYKTWYNYGILVDVSCTQISNALLQQASNDRLFNLQHNWILINSKSTADENHADTSTIAYETFETQLGSGYVLPESNVFLFVQIDDNAWEIWEGFRVSRMEKIQVHKHGTVTSNGLQTNKNYSILLRTDLRGISLKATTVIIEPKKFNGFYPFADTELDIFAYMHNDLNTVLQDQLNFKMNLDIVDSFGWDMGNGSFNGLTGRLQREESDFGGIGSFIRADRMTAVDYTVGMFNRQPAAMFKQPPLSSVRNICVLPFKFEVWMVTMFTFFACAVLIVFLARTAKTFQMDDDETLTVLDSVTIVHGAICQQGYTMNLNTTSIRIATFVLFLTAVFLFTSYSASIVAVLQSPSDSIKTVRDLVESPMTFTAQITPYTQVYFDETNDPLLRKLYDTKMKPNGKRKFTMASEGISRIRTEFHGFMVEVVSAYKLISRLWHEEEKCGFTEIQLFKLPVLALPVVKKSGYRDIFKQKLIQQHEVGLRSRIIRRWIPSKPICDFSNRANQFVSVSIKEIYPIIYIYGFGLCISFVILFFEISVNTYMSKYGKKLIIPYKL